MKEMTAKMKKMTVKKSPCDSCVYVDKSVDFVDFFEKTPKNRQCFLLDPVVKFCKFNCNNTGLVNEVFGYPVYDAYGSHGGNHNTCCLQGSGRTVPQAVWKENHSVDNYFRGKNTGESSAVNRRIFR